MQITKSVPEYLFSKNSFFQLKDIIHEKRSSSYILCILDKFFEKKQVHKYIEAIPNLQIKIRRSDKEPSTDEIDSLIAECKRLHRKAPDLIIGIVAIIRDGGNLETLQKSNFALFTSSLN